MTRRHRAASLSVLTAAALLLAVMLWAANASAQSLLDDGGASWRLEQPAPPPAPPGVPEAPAPIGLGRIGDIEFAPGMTNRGALITAGNLPTVPAGVWEFNGVTWHELSNKCGASDGRVIWAGPEEFWTISDGRPGGAVGPHGEPPPTRDNTLCRFSNPGHDGEALRIMESFAFPAFEADSYQEMNAGACLGPNDCWFVGNALPAESVASGSFQLHWNGATLTEEPYLGERDAIESAQAFEGRLYESVRIGQHDRETEPPALHVSRPDGSSPPFEPVSFEELPLYGSEEFPAALDFLHLSTGVVSPGEEILWAGAGPQADPESPEPGQVTVARDIGGAWRQVVGPERTEISGTEPFPGETVTSIAGEPGTEKAWMGLDSPQDYSAATSEIPGEEPSTTAYARVARVTAGGAISAEDEQLLPDEAGVGGKGAAFTMTCPAIHDCWLATTQGWLLHLSTEQEQNEMQDGAAQDHDPAFETLITERPPDQGLPLPPPVTLPTDDSGLLGELTATTTTPHVETTQHQESRVTLPLLSGLTTTRHGDLVELRFHLVVRARLKLLAMRGKRVVASTPARTFGAGRHSLRLRLDPRHWPTKLELQSHALAPLPTVSLNKSNETTVSTSLRFPSLRSLPLTGLLP